MASKICHIEIPSHDLSGSADFYAQLFGWECRPYGDGYTMFKDGDGIGGGFMAPENDMPGITLYILVDDIESKLEEIVRAGGRQLVPKTLINEEIGHFAIFVDPAGQRMGLFTPIKNQ